MKFVLSRPFFNAGPGVQRLFGFVSIYLLSNSTRFARVMMSSIKKKQLRLYNFVVSCPFLEGLLANN